MQDEADFVYTHDSVWEMFNVFLLLFQAEDWFCDGSQTTGGPGGAAHPGLNDAH